MKTKNAIKILNKKIKKDKELQAMIAEEQCNLDVANALRKLREDMGLTQAQLAKLTHTTQSVISRLEDADYHGHSLKILERMAIALNRRLKIQFVPLPKAS